MPRGVALYSGANLDNSGVGNGVMPKIQIEDAPEDLEVSARVVGDIDNEKGNLIQTDHHQAGCGCGNRRRRLPSVARGGLENHGGLRRRTE